MNRSALQKNIMPGNPIVVPNNSNGPTPFLVRFIERPEVGALSGKMYAQTYMGVTAGTSAGTEGDYENDD